MKKKIFLMVITGFLFAALLSSLITFISLRNHMILTEERELLNLARVIDAGMDPRLSPEEEIRRLKSSLKDKRLTIIGENGTVLADTSDEEEEFDNHSNREEVRRAFDQGEGTAIRYSRSLNTLLLYAAVRSEKEPYVLRISVHYLGALQYMRTLLPSLLLGFFAAGMFYLIFTGWFSCKISRPIEDISARLKENLRTKSTLPIYYPEYALPELDEIAGNIQKMDKERRETIASLEMQRAIRQEFFSNASHELKTPITSIMGYADLCLQGFATSEEQRKDFLRRIRDESKRMDTFVGDLLMISRLEAGESVCKKEWILLSAIVDEALESLRPAIAEQRIQIERDLQGGRIYADRTQMFHLVQNLISNAVKYNKEGGKIRITLRDEGEKIRFSVQDTGIGISEEDTRRVFERFYRVDKGRSRRKGGTGLGLSIVKHIVGFYGGTIQLTSSLGEGSTFLVELPKEAETPLI